MTTAPPTPPEGGRHGCPICPRRFDSVGDKKRHIRKKHPKETR